MSAIDNKDTGFDDSSVEPGVWRFAKARRATVIVDAENYFRNMQQAMLQAKKRILLIGWDFDTRIHLDKGRRWWQRGRSKEYPARLGSFILWLNRHRPELEIRILKWSYGFLKFFTRGSMTLDLMRWAPRRRIDFKFDTAHPVACSHHQKIVVIDDHVAVCGGIDMTTHRWDTREHKEDDPRRKRPRGSYYDPWHDATMMVEGEVASALGELGRDRWERAGGKPLTPVGEVEGSAWPEDLEAQFEDVEIGIARTRAKYKEAPQICEIADLFVKQISEAKEYIYAESQYFASRKIADAICKRMSEPNPPEVLIVHPKNAEGWLEQQAMDNARAQLVKAIGEVDPHGQFNLYVPYTGETPIYVHAKIMIIDDRIMRIGSANMNNRSMGLDSECDMFIDASRPGNEHAKTPIARLRHDLLAEHCGLDPEEVPGLLSRYGSMHRMIQQIGTDRSRTLRRFDLEDTNAVQENLAESELLDPEHPDDMFEPFADGGLFPRDTSLRRAKKKIKEKVT
ncbi:phospholipase D-like domain-containing protein [Erythrobacter sp. HKB08]|uniref:phospholipase D-like domain-containing protein n=1 Tax=Erythrobacter sp. HKB08 TaxID=2502843 RepID=UPI0010093424|nr:phospholipase D-like domain-containing protein [Erythrobacter sp. HKB08]